MVFSFISDIKRTRASLSASIPTEERTSAISSAVGESLPPRTRRRYVAMCFIFDQSYVGCLSIVQQGADGLQGGEQGEDQASAGDLGQDGHRRGARANAGGRGRSTTDRTYPYRGQ